MKELCPVSKKTGSFQQFFLYVLISLPENRKIIRKVILESESPENQI